MSNILRHHHVVQFVPGLFEVITCENILCFSGWTQKRSEARS